MPDTLQSSRMSHQFRFTRAVRSPQYLTRGNAEEEAILILQDLLDQKLTSAAEALPHSEHDSPGPRLGSHPPTSDSSSIRAEALVLYTVP